MIGDLVFETGSYFGIFLLHNDLNYLFYLNKIIIPEMLYSALVLLIIIKPLFALNPHLNSRDRRRLGELNEGDI
jgi:rod shape-determining protein MreD